MGRLMRYTQAEKMEIVRLVETSELSVKRTLAELGIPRSTFYGWYRRYSEDGYAGLANRSSQPRRGIAFPMRSRSMWSTWPSSNPRNRRVNWPGISLIQNNTSSPRRVCTAFSSAVT